MSDKRSPVRRVLVILIAGLAVLILAAALILPAVLDVETHRGRVEAMLQQATGWEAELGEMDLSVFPRIALEVNPASLTAPGDGSKLTIDKIRVRAELFPLLRGKLIVREIQLLQPEILIVRSTIKGGWDLPLPAAGRDAPPAGGAPVATEGGEQATAEKPGPSSPAGKKTGLAVSIEEVRVAGGRLRFEDRAGEPPLSIDLHDVEFALFPASNTIRGEAGIAEHKARARFEGTLGEALDLEIEDLPTEVLEPWLGKELIHAGGLLDGTAEVRWPMEVQGKVTARKLTLLAGERPFESADLDFHLTTEAEAWRLQNMRLDAEGTRVTGSGSLLPAVALKLEMPDTPLETTLRATESVMPLPLDLSPPGTVNASLRVDQPEGGELSYEASGALSAAAFRPGEMLPPVEGIRTTFNLDRAGALTIRIHEGRVGGGPLSGTAKLASLDPPGKLVFDGGVRDAILGQLLGGMVNDAAKRMTGPTGLNGSMGLDLSRETLDARALTGRLELDAQQIGLPGWDLEGAIRAKVIEKLGSLGGVAARLAGGDKAPSAESAGKTLLDAMQARVNFDNQPWGMENLALAAGGVRAAGSGTFDPFEGKVDLRVTSRLDSGKSRDFVARYSQAKVLVDRNGEIVLPMHIKGSIYSPSISVDVGDVLSKSVESKVEKKAKDLLKNLLDR